LNRHGVRYLVVGGYAFAFHAIPRYTKDIDIFLEPSVENAELLMAALTDFGFGDAGLSVEDFSTPDKIIRLGREPNCADLITSIQGVDFEEAWNGRVEGRYGNETVHFLGRAELIRNKESAGRPQDLADVAALRAADDTAGGTED
jgi:hypothetical protein